MAGGQSALLCQRFYPGGILPDIGVAAGAGKTTTLSCNVVLLSIFVEMM